METPELLGKLRMQSVRFRIASHVREFEVQFKEDVFMNSQIALKGMDAGSQSVIGSGRPLRKPPAPVPFRFTAYEVEEETGHRHAELFYLQKQIQSQTPMVIVLADGGKIEGCIEWYDRRSLKVRGRQKTLVYKSAIKYMYKLGEVSP